SAQIQATHQVPNRSRGVVFSDQPVYVDRPPTHLLPVHKTNQRMVRRLIWLGHAPRIADDQKLSRANFAKVFSQLLSKGGVFSPLFPSHSAGSIGTNPASPPL